MCVCVLGRGECVSVSMCICEFVCMLGGMSEQNTYFKGQVCDYN